MGLKENRYNGITVGLAFVMILAGCETTSKSQREQEEVAKQEKQMAKKMAELSKLQDAEARVWDVFDPLMQEASNYEQSETFGYVGAVFVAEAFYPERMRTTLRRYSVGPYVSVSQVFPDSPAERAGLMAGDRVLSINGKRLPRWDGAARYAAVKLKRVLRLDKANEFLVKRRGQELKLQVLAEKAAVYTVIVSPGLGTDLRADGEMIWMNLDMVESLKDPSDLAYTCAFALAQSIMRQPEKRRKNSWLGSTMDVAMVATGLPTLGVMGGLTGNSRRKDFVLEADLIALYLLTARGFDISKYPDFWARQLPRNPQSWALEVESAERLEVQQQIIASIEKKRASGAFIFPVEYLGGDASEVVLNRFGQTGLGAQPFR